MIQPVVMIISLIYMGVASYSDIKERRIPNPLILAGLAIGLVLYALGLSAPDGVNAAILVFVVMFIAYSINISAIGGGDVKLAVVIALFLGLYNGLFALLIGFGACAICGIVNTILKKGTMKTKYPLAPFMSIGVIVVILQDILLQI